MSNYKANSTNSLNFELTYNNKKIGELIYGKWYSFNANIHLFNGDKLKLEPKGFWNSKVELKNTENILLEFKMGWNGIIIKTFFNNKEENYLLTQKGLLSNKFILLDTEKNEILVAESNFKWKNLNYDYNIETSQKFDNTPNKDILILTILHCINYYITIIVSAG